MKWFKRIIAGHAHHEFRNEDHEPYIYLFDIEVMSDNSIWLYDLKNNGTHYVGFKNLREAKKIAIESLTDKSVLTPYIDHKWIEDGKRFVDIISKTNELLKQLKENGTSNS